MNMLQRGDEFEVTKKGGAGDGCLMMMLLLLTMTMMINIDILSFSGSRPLVVAFDRCSKLLLLMHRCDVTFTSDAMLEQIIVNLLPFLKEIRSRFVTG
jgi:hypothetical protein